MKSVLTVLVSGLCLGIVFCARAEPLPLSAGTEQQLDALIRRADELRLSETKQWRALMHYHDRLLTHESTIDSPGFFLAEDGKTNPDSELKAALRAFFRPSGSVPAKEGESKDYRHPQCLFPARLAWLDQKLDFRRVLPRVECTEYEDFREKVNGRRLAFIYTSAYIGNPASFFGHTLLRIDGPEDLPLLSHAVNYGAVTGADGGIPFMVKGVFGGYPGVFSVSPYYDAVNTYNNMENRDIWEYRLTLPREQIDFLTAHIWEAGNNYADYYFFSENCSYMLMEMLDTVYPDAGLADRFNRPYFSNYVVPADTIRTLLNRPGLLEEAVYRPSRRTRIRHSYAHLSEAEKKELRKVLHAPRRPDEVMDSALTPVQKANVLETAYEYLQYEFLARHIGLDEMRADTVRLLSARSRIPEKSDFPEIPVPAVRPDQGHGSAMVGLYGGRRNGKTFIDLRLRPAYHSLSDETGGYIPFEEISYLDTELRWYEAANELRVERLTLMGLRSLAPRNELFKPLAFHIATGLESYAYPPKGEEGYVFFLDGGIGLSYEILPRTVFFGFANLHGKAGGSLPHNSLGGAGLQAGINSSFDKVRLSADVERILYTDSDADTTRYGAEASFSLSRNLTFSIRWTFEDNRRNDVHEGRAGFQYFF